MINPIVVPMTVSVAGTSLPVNAAASAVTAHCAVAAAYSMLPVPTYDGPTEVTPSDEEQTLHTLGTALLQDITVHKIPSNYGRISLTGNIITVS